MPPASAFRQLSPVPVYSGTGLFLDYRDNEYQTSYSVKLFDNRNHMKVSTLNMFSFAPCPFPLLEPVLAPLVLVLVSLAPLVFSCFPSVCF